jgi:hypothetical protein
MNKNNIYDKWIEHRKKVHLSENFSGHVIDKIIGLGKDSEMNISELQILDFRSILNWMLRFALTFGLLALNYQWAY